MITSNLLRKRAFLIFYLVFLLVGLFTFNDYGISWDEPACRSDLGIVNHNFIFKGDYKTLQISNAKYHGPAFELFLYECELLLNLKDMRVIFLMRHLLTFLLFAAAVYFFYKLCRRQFKSEWIAFLGPVLLVLSPRIYADAFYNSKDLAFLSMLVISMYTTMVFLERKNFKTGIIHAFVTAVTIDIRVIGVIIPVFTCAALFIDILKEKEQRERMINQFFYFSILTAFFIIIFWPIMWRHTFENFDLAIKENSKFPWNGLVLFKGLEYWANQLPSDYLLIWMLVSIPVLYTLFFILSFFFLPKKVFTLKLTKAELLSLLIIFLPISAAIFLHSVLYDGWRHFYFITPALIFLSLTGLQSLVSWINKIKIERIIQGGFAAYCIYIAIVMIRLHPYENLYFNVIAGKSLKEIKSKFELDYWCLSYREGLEHILSKDTSSSIWVYGVEADPTSFNTLLLNKADRSRIYITGSPRNCDYYMAAYRAKRGPFNGKIEYEVVRDGASVLSVFNTKGSIAQIFNQKHFIGERMNDYEGVPKPSGKIIEMKRDSKDNFVEEINSEIIFAGGTSMDTIPENLKSSEYENYMAISFLLYTKENCDLQVVIQVDSGGGGAHTHWLQQETTNGGFTDKWLKKELHFLLPEFGPKDKVIQTFIINSNKNNFYIDDMDVKLYSVPKEEIKELVTEVAQ